MERVMSNNPLFLNAIDSLKVGIDYYVNEPFETAHKHSILTIYHSIELLLKEKLYRVHPILIYTNINKKINDDSNTVGLNDILIRFENLSIDVSNFKSILIDLQKRRNRIEHHKYDEELDDNITIGKSLKFIYDFLQNHLNENIEDYVESDDLHEMKELIFSYNELVKEAKEKAIELAKSKINFSHNEESINLLFCPLCSEETMVVDSSGNGLCTYCDGKERFYECESCYELSLNLSEYNLCEICSDNIMNKLMRE
jgi:hypothetical protein